VLGSLQQQVFCNRHDRLLDIKACVDAGDSITQDGLLEDLAASEAVMSESLAAAQSSMAEAAGREQQTLV